MDPADSLTIVAIPDSDDPVWKFSSEKVPHMTILFLGDQSKNPNVNQIVEYVEHATTHLSRFGLSVERRGLLGDQDADVLFLSGYDSHRIDQFRDNLLANDEIKKAYCSTTQYPSWTKHLTMGYPETPAKPDTRDYPGINWVNFNRIAVWTGDYEGPTFELNSQDIYGGVAAMSENGALIYDYLEHFGVKGMKWGVIRDKLRGGSSGPEAVTVTQRKPGSALKTKGGRGHNADQDAVGAAAAAQKARKSGIHSLSNKELQTLVSRMNLEQQYVNLKSKEPGRFAAGTNAIKKILGLGKTANEVFQLVNSPAGKELQKLLKK